MYKIENCIENLKVWFHCRKCRNFKGCPIRYNPFDQDIYTRSYVSEGKLVLSDPKRCSNPME